MNREKCTGKKRKESSNEFLDKCLKPKGIPKINPEFQEEPVYSQDEFPEVCGRIF